MLDRAVRMYHRVARLDGPPSRWSTPLLPSNRAIAESLQAAFEGDVVEHFRQARADAKGCNAA
jgi:hypothetical protein